MMDRSLTKPEVMVLGPDQVVALRRGKGLTISCDEGEIWITEDGDLRDTVLRAGGRITLERPGPALVSAFVDSRIVVQATAASVGVLTALWHGVARRLGVAGRLGIGRPSRSSGAAITLRQAAGGCRAA